MRQYNPISNIEEIEHTSNITSESCTQFKNSISQRLRVWLTQMMPMNLQMFEVIKNFIPHLDTQFIKKIFYRLMTRVRCEEYHLKHKHSPPYA